MSTARVPFQPRIRPLTSADVDRVMDIEREAYPFPWTRTIFEDCIRVGYDCHGLLVGSSLCGYTVQTQAMDESHLLNLCIGPQWQRQGFGSMLLRYAIRLARSHACVSMFLEVRPSNEAGVALYQRNGFQVIGIRRDYYRADEGREDAVVMRLELGPQSEISPTGRATADPF